MYGNKSQGVMIGFNRSVLEQHYNKTEMFDCIYAHEVDSKFKENINSLLQESFLLQKPRPDTIPRKFYNLHILAKFVSFVVPYIKHECFKYENETRVITLTKTPKFRVLNNLLIPYTELLVPISALESIMIGPNCDSRDLLSIKMLALSKGIDNLFDNITQSTLPFKI